MAPRNHTECHKLGNSNDEMVGTPVGAPHGTANSDVNSGWTANDIRKESDWKTKPNLLDY